MKTPNYDKLNIPRIINEKFGHCITQFRFNKRIFKNLCQQMRESVFLNLGEQYNL